MFYVLNDMIKNFFTNSLLEIGYPVINNALSIHVFDTFINLYTYLSFQKEVHLDYRSFVMILEKMSLWMTLSNVWLISATTKNRKQKHKHTITPKTRPPHPPSKKNNK